ncbi:MAG: hypothetical protein IJ071_03860 [Ruminococcus sp.]|nr:hypothetical protein [Ruminococcus sp.]
MIRAFFGRSLLTARSRSQHSPITAPAARENRKSRSSSETVKKVSGTFI